MMVVTEDALYKRLNRKLKKYTSAQVLKRTRGEWTRQNLGDYYTAWMPGMKSEHPQW